MNAKRLTPADLPPLRTQFATFADFVAATPFTDPIDARKYCTENPQYSYFGLRKDNVSRYGLRPAGSSQSNPVAPGSIPADHVEPKKAVAAARQATRGTPRYVELLQMLRSGPVTIDEVVNKWGCTRAAASSLFSDVKNKCGAGLAREGDTYKLEGR